MYKNIKSMKLEIETPDEAYYFFKSKSGSEKGASLCVKEMEKIVVKLKEFGVKKVVLSWNR